MNILGISAFYHDSAACLVQDGVVVSAAEEERFSRTKHDNGFPADAVRCCLSQAGIGAHQLDLVAFYDKPFLKFERILETALEYAPAGFRSFALAVPSWLGTKLWVRSLVRTELGYQGQVLFAEHHRSHAASAFYPSPFAEAAILTVDGVGEWTTTSYGVGTGNRIDLRGDIHFPHSLGLLYSAFTSYLGFKANDGECKVMGLASYGKPSYRNLILDNLIDLRDDGSFALNMDYFAYCTNLVMTTPRFHGLFGGPPRVAGSQLSQRHADIARSVQDVTEEAMLRMSRHVHRETGQTHLCLAGGVALNCVANGRIVREGPFRRVWVQPAAGDAGGALGAALLAWYDYCGNARCGDGEHDSQQGSLLGPSCSHTDAEMFLRATGVPYRRLDERELVDEVADRLAVGKVVAWFQEGMEFGPRALGNRSILADPRSTTIRERLNSRVKFRESFRPFAPAVLADRASEFFELECESPYMLLAARVRDDAPVAVPGVTHVDGTARVQTVRREDNPRLHALLDAFDRRHGCPVLLNTSLNVRGEPIACTPQDAYRCFISTDIDCLVLGPFLVEKRPCRKVNGAAMRWERLARTCASAAAGSLFVCPLCSESLVQYVGGLRCPRCETTYPLEEGIPQLFRSSQGTEHWQRTEEATMRFYDEHPFPDYEDTTSASDLLTRGHESAFLAALDRGLHAGQRVLEVGCGTGQLSNYLGLRGNTVVGADMSLGALQLGEGFRARAGLDNVGFVHMNLFRPALLPGSFPLVVCNGVLHHTPDPLEGLHAICGLLSEGGFVVVGLYNGYGRLPHHIRKSLSRVVPSSLPLLDPYLRASRRGPRHRQAWFTDQYRNPYESSHTIGQVLRWFDACGLELVRTVTGTSLQQMCADGPSLFEPEPRSTAVERVIEEVGLALAGGREGGFFVSVGRRVV